VLSWRRTSSRAASPRWRLPRPSVRDCGGAGRGWPPATTGHHHCRRPDGGTGDGQLRGIGRHRRHRDGRGGRAAPVPGRAARAVNGDHVRRRRADTWPRWTGASGGSYSASAGVRPPTAARGWPVRWACDFSTPTFVTCPGGRRPAPAAHDRHGPPRPAAGRRRGRRGQCDVDNPLTGDRGAAAAFSHSRSGDQFDPSPPSGCVGGSPRDPARGPPESRWRSSSSSPHRPAGAPSTPPPRRSGPCRRKVREGEARRYDRSGGDQQDA
jgi:hypothetical protein